MIAKATIRLTVNGQARSVETEPERPLLDLLREDLALTGTKYGCGERQCGACSVLVDGKRVFSCRTPVSACDGKQVRTIEGLAHGDELHPVQAAFLDCSAFQCGFCTAGMIMTAVGLLEERPGATREEIAQGMNRNICRCCSYPKILAAVEQAAGQMRAKS